MDAAFRRTVNLTVLSVRASRELAVRLTALRPNRQSADVAPRSHPDGTDGRRNAAAGERSDHVADCSHAFAGLPRGYIRRVVIVQESEMRPK